MKINIVNENRKDLEYAILDDTPELNLPSVKDGNDLIVKNKFSGKTYQVTPEMIRTMFPYLIYRYNIYVKSLHSKCSKISKTFNFNGTVICEENECPLSSSFSISNIEWESSKETTKIVTLDTDLSLNDDIFVGIKDILFDRGLELVLPVMVRFLTSDNRDYSIVLSDYDGSVLKSSNDLIHLRLSKLTQIKFNLRYKESDFMADQALDGLNELLLRFLDRFHLIRFPEDNQIAFEKIFDITYEDTYFEVNGVKFPTIFQLNSYNKEEFDEMTIDRIDQIVNEFNEKKNELISKYITGILDINIPDLYDVDEFIFSKDYTKIPEILSSNYILDFPRFKILEDLENVHFDVDLLNRLSSEIPEKMTQISGSIDLVNASIPGLSTAIDSIKKFAKIKFRTFDQTTGKSMPISYIKLNGEIVDKSELICDIIDGKYSYSFSGVTTNPYKITIFKKGYDELNFTIRPKFAYSIDDVDVLDLGDLYLFNEGQEMLFTLTWGEVPADLDFHVYSFAPNFFQLEHVYFENKHTNGSDIWLDYDDTTSYGPEHVQILNLDRSKYYLFCVHNFSLYQYGISSDAHMNYEKKTRIRIRFYHKTYEIEPINDGGEYDFWLDAFVIHDEKFYILNSFASYMRDRRETFSFNANKVELNKLIEKIENAKEVISFEEFRKTGNLDVQEISTD